MLAALKPVADELTTLAWLTGTQRSLDGRRPVDALRQGDGDEVVTLAQRLAWSVA